MRTSQPMALRSVPAARSIPAGFTAIAGTNSATPGAVTDFPLGVPADGLAVSENPNTPFLYGNSTGVITKVDLTTSPPTITNIVTGGSRGDFAHCWL